MRDLFILVTVVALLAGTLLGLVLFLLVVPSLVIGPDFNLECLRMWWHRILTPFIVEGAASPMEINQSMVGVLTRLLTTMTYFGILCERASQVHEQATRHVDALAAS